MCGPAASFMVSAASSIVGFMGDTATANAQNEMWKANYKNALTASQADYRQLQTRMMQEDAADTQKRELSILEEAEKGATAQVMAGDVGGLSVKRIVQDISRKSAINRNTIDINARYTAAQITEEMKGVKTRAEGRINSVQRATPPSPLVPMLQIAGAGVKAFGQA